jgi:uncharacterized protein YciI
VSVFAVQYFYSAEADQLAEIRPIHREWLTQLLADGSLLASGPLVDFPGALLIFKAASLEELSHLLDHDPFDIAGFIGERTVSEWNPIFGPFSEIK